MRLNKLILAGTLVATGGLMSSCDTDWLDIKNNTKDLVEDYYIDASKMEEALVAAYDPMHWFDFAQSYVGINLYPECVADQCYPGGSDANDQRYLNRTFNFNIAPTEVAMSGWENAYSGVKRCNDVLYYMENYWKKDNPECGYTPELEAYITSQVLALRVFFYNYVWKWWGNIPYYTENLQPGNGYTATQYSEDEVYEFMMQDLEKVIASNNLKWKTEGDELGRITLPMVYMLYTEIVMYHCDGENTPTKLEGHKDHVGSDDARMAKALEYMKQIINSPEYGLVDDFASIWPVEGEWCKESIYEINYSNMNAGRNWSWGGTCGGTVVPEMIGPNNYKKLDGIHGGGWGYCPVRKSTYDSFEAGDTRRDASIWIPEENSYDKRFQDTGYFLAKYAPRLDYNKGADPGALNYNNNLRLYRYSEVLLNAAELVVRGAGSGDAQGWLDQVRRRAGLGSKPATLANIIDERKLEFLGEGKRYWDILRSGLGETVLVADHELPQSDANRQNSYTKNKKHIPFSLSTIERGAGSIVQNPYVD